ncbi:SIR2 family protein [Tenacibaculum maritimum]|uniref:SIR2 family protein n=1 Tax=Tenacibaculum maritimum TaxID=107401 RepID=UPI0003F89015|nr:SIR2 family protein [Tenacibaculum maritimum]
MPNQLMYDEFLRSISIGKESSYTMLIGAGCSISSDIQSANDCIWEWKKIIYKSNNPNVQNWIENYKSSKTQSVIQNWLDNQGTYVEKDNVEEYSFYAKKCFPIDENRRQYFQKICSNKAPAIGYRTLPLLAKHGMLDSVWTTNFDDLIQTACINGGVQGIDVSLETVGRINQRTQNKNELPIIKLHGDFKYGDLKNTSEELKNQDETLRNKLIDYLSDKNLIVIGYSGRDKSLMDSLKQAYSKPGGGILFWCGYGNNINNDVSDLLEHVEKSGRKGFYIGTEGFDNTMLNLTKHVIDADLELEKEFEEVKKSYKYRNDFSDFNLNIDRVNKVLKSNLFPINFPREVLVFSSQIDGNPWDLIKEKTLNDFDISAIPYGKDIWAFGTVEKVHQTFSEVIQGDIQRKPLTDIKIYKYNIKYLLLSSVSKLLSKYNNLETNYKDKIWSLNDYKTINGVKVYNAISLDLEKIQGQYYLSLNPDFHIDNIEISKEVKQSIGLKFFHYIRNSQYNNYIDKWRRGLLNQKESIFEFPANSGTGFTFRIKKAPIFTNICNLNNPYINNHDVPETLLKLKGVQFKEVELMFSSNNGSKVVREIHPMNGLVNNSPFDKGLSNLQDKTINLGVVCPVEDSRNLYNFLTKQNSEIKNPNLKDQYVIDYKGFYNTYGVSLNIPEISSSNWETINEPLNKEIREIVHEIKTNICDKINQLCSIGSKKTIVIFIPSRWDSFTYYRDELQSFDLHDYIKAFCAEKKVTSQLIREKTIIDNSLQCQINWWLSLSFFVKSFRTPWVINKTDNTTAFAGIGYSVESKKEDKGHVILGCSHIYNSNGEGLKYKLSKINDKINWINRKPHLSYDDAYEFGKNVINLFYESMNEVPKRVVIHKRTFYTEDERKGILDSLYDNQKIENVDLIEINFENNIRYVSSKIKYGKAEIDGYSVSRGTCIQLNNREALLYGHGVIPSAKNPSYNYYPGGRYIPKPLRIIKHHGVGSLEQIANEILGLTKMNWNSLNMYSQLPATIDSSNRIAKIGKLIENRDKIEYDYRYFI